MERWIQVFLNVVDNLLKHPGTALEKWSLIIPGCLFFLWVYARTGHAFGTHDYGGLRGVITPVLGLALVLAAMTAVSLYFPADNPWLQVGLPAVAVSLIVVVPLICLIQRAGLMAAFMTWLISVAALAAIMLLISAGFEAFGSGRGQAEKSRMHKQAIEQLSGERR